MRVHCGFVPATSSVVYVPVTSVCYTWFFPGTRPYGYTARHFVAVTSFTEGHHVPTTRSCDKCVCVCCTWLGIRCTFLTYVRSCTVLVLSSLHVPVTYIPECTADEFFSGHKRAQNNTPYRLVVLTFKGSISQVAKKTKRWKLDMAVRNWSGENWFKYLTNALKSCTGKKKHKSTVVNKTTKTPKNIKHIEIGRNNK